ncbi:hypothetical protein EVAR_78854_1 [Eumeta japonica]|uniref:Histone-lysine N-methyltransferase SETMAR n=1 Tax=Eumeta variegata TaxID=151549 RepID=A0A4C1U2K0_EUMVA|nr:hypothetical protein EVAR_78854_1 [Eumeta japonica]
MLINDEYIERLKDSLGEIKQYECLELHELWKVPKSVLVDEPKKDDNGYLLIEENIVKERWKKYFESVFGYEDTVADLEKAYDRVKRNDLRTTLSVRDVGSELIHQKPLGITGLVGLIVGGVSSRTNLKIIHHDNASCHTSAETTRVLEGQKIELTGHPPYSSDLVLNGFYLFPSVKIKLRGQPFSSCEEAVDSFKMHVL